MHKAVKYLLYGGVTLLAIFIVLASIGNNKTENIEYEHPFTVLDDVDSSPVAGIADGNSEIVEAGWSTPVKLPVSDEGREDSTHITRDGRYLLFYHDPTVGAFQESVEGGEKEDPVIYYSKRPFVTRNLHPISTDDFKAEAGPSISEAGDIYYTKTFIVLEPTPHEATPFKTVVNDGSTIIDMGTGEAEGDPFYCDALDELYANVMYGPGDQAIAVYKNGEHTFLPEPINLPGSMEFQPFLTDDCQTMYFTSSRAATNGIFPFQVYKSQRLGEFEWGEPELFVSFPQLDGKSGGVGEFTMTRDQKQMVYTELVITEINGEWAGQNEMYYSDKY